MNVPAPLLDLTDLAVTYRGETGGRPSVHVDRLTVEPGAYVTLIGESGSGKSTIARAVLGLLPRSATVTGSIQHAGRELRGLPERQCRRLRGASIGLVPQDPMSSLNPSQPIGRQIAETLLLHGKADRRQAARIAVDWLEKVEIADPAAVARQRPHELSGGMKQRVLIATVLAAQPRLLVADEPTSALDVTLQRQVLDLIDQLGRDAGAGVLLVTHDLGVAAERSDHVVVLEAGRVVEQGPTSAVLAVPTSTYTRTLVTSAPTLAVDRPVRAVSAEAVLTLDGVSKTFALPGGATRTALDDVSLRLHRGETLGLVGESGSGKSTIARIALGLTRPTTGFVTVDGVTVTGPDQTFPAALRARVQLVQQDAWGALDPRWDVETSIGEAIARTRPGRVRTAEVSALLDRVALPSTLLGRGPGELSGGQRQRVVIARALAMEPEVLVCDEPVSALDMTVQAQILALLGELRDENGLSLLFISHDLGVIATIADRLVVLKDGTVRETGPVADVIADPQDPYTQALVAAVPAVSSTLARSSA